jgi:hypothetical protein
MDFVEGEISNCSETCVTVGVDGTGEGSIAVGEAVDVKEEVCIKVEETIDIKDEIPEPIKFPAIKTEYEVRLQGVREVIPAYAVRPFIALKRKL